MTSEVADEEKIQVRFITKNAELTVPETPFLLPLQMSRPTLSTTINHLLNLDVSPKQFDFLIGGEFLRSTLKVFIKKKNISREDVLEIEYVESLSKPQTNDKQLEHPAWVSCVDGSKQGLALSGCYDSKLRLWDLVSGECALTVDAHAGTPIKSLAWLTRGKIDASNRASVQTVITTSQDFLAKSFNINVAARTAEHDLTFKGHTGSVDCVAVRAGGRPQFATGAWDHLILLWDPTPSTESDADADVDNAKRKKRRVEPSQERYPVRTLEGHTQAVSALQWPTSDRIYSGGHDHSLRVWDVESGTNITTLNGNKLINDISYSLPTGLIASAHADRTVCLWDPRAPEGEVIKRRLTSHKLWVSKVVWHPTCADILITSSYDNTVKLWDVRSAVPLYTLTAHTDKVLCADWCAGDEGEHALGRFVSGGADNVVRLHRSQLPVSR